MSSQDPVGQPVSALLGADCGLSAADLLRRMKWGTLLFLDGRNEHGSHVLTSFPTGLNFNDNDLVSLGESAEEILTKAEAMGFPIGSHVWARFSWVREEYHHGYLEFAEIDEDVTRIFHAVFPGLDGIDPDGPKGQDGQLRDEPPPPATGSDEEVGGVSAYQDAVTEIERELGWTEDDASNCGCNYREEPCERCWSLGWRIGGIPRDVVTPTPNDKA